jgi:hypothetical protein
MKRILFILITVLITTIAFTSCECVVENKLVKVEYKYEIGDIFYYKLDNKKCIVKDFRTKDIHGNVLEYPVYWVQFMSNGKYIDASIKEDLVYQKTNDIVTESNESNDNKSYTEKLIDGDI